MTANVHPLHPLARRASDQTDLVGLYLATLSPGSMNMTRWRLNLAARLLSDGRLDADTLAWHRVGYPDALKLRAALVTRYAARSTSNGVIAAVKGVWVQCREMGLLVGDRWLQLSHLKYVRGNSLPAGRAVNHTDLGACFDALERDESLLAYRRAAMLALLYATGLRRGELCALRMQDYDPVTGTITVLAGKGNRQRFAYVGDASLRRYVDRWIMRRGTIDGWLICGVDKHGNVRRASRYSGEMVHRELAAIAALARVPQFRPHDMRRTTATHLLDSGVDIEIVSRILGHQRIETTMKYVRRGEDSKQAAAARLVRPRRD